MVGCKTNQENNFDVFNKNAIEINIPLKEVGQEDFIEKAEYIFLDQEYLIGKIGRILFFENVIYIHDEMTDRLIAFTRKGKYLFKIDEKGKGPMEYLKLTDFSIDKNRRFILIYDSYGHKLLKFSIDEHKFVEEQTVDFYPIAFAWNDNRLFFYNPYTINYSGESKFHFSLIQLNDKLKNEKKYFKVDENMGKFMVNPNRKGFFYGEGLCLLNRFDNVIYSLKDSIRVHCKIVFKDNEDYNSALAEAVLKGTIETGRYKKCATYIHHYCENDKLITFRYMKNNILYSTIFSKEKNRIIYHKRSRPIITTSNMEQNIPVFMFPSYINDNLFVSVLPFELLNLITTNKKIQKLIDDNVADKRLVKQLSNLDDNSNPVLVFSKIKS